MPSITYVNPFLQKLFHWFAQLPAVQQWIASAVSLATMSWAGVKLTLRFWDWPVLRFMEGRQREVELMRGHNLVVGRIPIYMIARQAWPWKCSYRATTKSLLRLEKAGKVYQVRRRYWLPGKRPNRNSSPDIGRWERRY